MEQEFKCFTCGYTTLAERKDEPRCPNCFISAGEQTGQHVVLVQADIPIIEEDFF